MCFSDQEVVGYKIAKRNSGLLKLIFKKQRGFQMAEFPSSDDARNSKESMDFVEQMFDSDIRTSNPSFLPTS